MMQTDEIILSKQIIAKKNFFLNNVKPITEYEREFLLSTENKLYLL